MNFDPGVFKSLGVNPGGTLELFDKYIDTIELIFELAFRKSDGTSYAPTDKEKSNVTSKRRQLHERLISACWLCTKEDDYKTSIDKIRKGLQSRTNAVVQRNLLFANFPQGTKSFESWSKKTSSAAKLINFEGYNWKQATVDSLILQTSSPKLRERALQDNINYEDLLKLGIAKEQSQKGAALLEKASGQDPLLMSCTTEEVRHLQL